MNQKRKFPLYIIDRTKATSHPFDFVTCLHQQFGFVARVVAFYEDAPFNEFVKQAEQIQNADYHQIASKFRKGGVILVVEYFLYEFDNSGENAMHVKTLLKKGLKKYLHAEVERTPFDDLGIENQIKQQELTIERTLQNYEQLLKRANGDAKYADYQLQLARATVETLKQYRDNQKFFTLNMN